MKAPVVIQVTVAFNREIDLRRLLIQNNLIKSADRMLSTGGMKYRIFGDTETIPVELADQIEQYDNGNPFGE